MRNNDKVKLPNTKSMHEAWRRAFEAIVDGGATCPNDPVDPCPQNEGDPNAGCRRHAVVVPGFGTPDFPFPTVDDIVAAVVENFQTRAREYAKHGLKLTIGHDPKVSGDQMLRFIAESMNASNDVELLTPQLRSRLVKVVRSMRHNAIDNLPKVPVNKLIPEADGVTMTETPGPILRVAGGTLAHIMYLGRFKAVIARMFDQFKGACTWALKNMDPKYHEAAGSLLTQLEKLESIYAEALPRIIQFLGAQYPNATDEELLNAAVSMLNEQVMQFLVMMSIYSDGFAQKRDGMYPQVDYLTFTVEQALRLFRTGDVTVRCNPEYQEAIKTQAFHIGDVFLPRLSDQGPATIPGGRGPVGAHAIEVPFDEADVLVTYLPLYLHEFRHDYYNDVLGLQDSMTEAVVTAIQAAHEAGKFKFTSETLTLGKQQVRTIDMITQVFAQTLSETDADIAGGIMLSGEAFVYSMLATFCAFNMQGSSPFAINRMLRAGSYFGVDEQGHLGFEPHMPDLMRVHVCADALELRGFKAAADECRRLANMAGGKPAPKFIIWRNVDPKSRFRFEIKLAIEDLRQVSPVVVDAIMNAPLAAQGGLSTTQLVNWNEKRQAKVDALVAQLMQGKSDIPWEMGDFWAPYVAAAAIKACWGLWKSGEIAPVAATYMVEKNARRMMDAVMKRFQEQDAASSGPDCGCDEQHADGHGDGAPADGTAGSQEPAGTGAAAASPSSGADGGNKS